MPILAPEQDWQEAKHSQSGLPGVQVAAEFHLSPDIGNRSGPKPRDTVVSAVGTLPGPGNMCGMKLLIRSRALGYPRVSSVHTKAADQLEGSLGMEVLSVHWGLLPIQAHSTTPSAGKKRVGRERGQVWMAGCPQVEKQGMQRPL